jgi:hypothetical protein
MEVDDALAIADKPTSEVPGRAAMLFTSRARQRGATSPLDQASNGRSTRSPGAKARHNSVAKRQIHSSGNPPLADPAISYAARFPGPNDSGNSSPNVTVRRGPSESQMCTGVVLSANLRSRWRQPHGEISAGPLPITSTSRVAGLSQMCLAGRHCGPERAGPFYWAAAAAGAARVSGAAGLGMS